MKNCTARRRLAKGRGLEKVGIDTGRMLGWASKLPERLLKVFIEHKDVFYSLIIWLMC